MGKITKRTVKALVQLISEGEVSVSQLKDELLIGRLLSAGCVRRIQLTRSQAKYVLVSEDALRLCCRDYDIRMKDLEACVKDMESGVLNVKPSQEIARYGEDHVRKRNLWKGFFLKSNRPVEVVYFGNKTVIDAKHPLLVEDGNSVIIDGVKNCVLWVVENYECFQNLSWLKAFGLDGELSLVVCRWPLSARARSCYGMWPVKEKRYFGDFDLAGVNIFQTEFAKDLGKEAFFIPASLKEDIRKGSMNLFDRQWKKFRNIKGLTKNLEYVIFIIMLEKKGLSQEFYLI